MRPDWQAELFIGRLFCIPEFEARDLGRLAMPVRAVVHFGFLVVRALLTRKIG